MRAEQILRIILDFSWGFTVPNDRSKNLIAALAAAAVIAVPLFAAAEESSPKLLFEDHHFTPRILTVPAGQALVVKVANQSKETIEFESFKLNRETVVQPGETVSVHLPAMSAGDYDFYDDFHDDVPQGSIVAK